MLETAIDRLCFFTAGFDVLFQMKGSLYYLTSKDKLQNNSHKMYRICNVGFPRIPESGEKRRLTHVARLEVTT